MRREHGLKGPGRFKDLTGKRWGPNADLVIIGRALDEHGEPMSKPDGRGGARALWRVRHDPNRGGCGLERITTTEQAKKGACPCRKSAAFKAQTRRAFNARMDAEIESELRSCDETDYRPRAYPKRRGKRPDRRLFPLKEGGREAIAAANTRDRIAGKRGLTTLPRDKHNRVLKASRAGRGGRARDYTGSEAERNAARQRAFRERQRAAKTGEPTPRQYGGKTTVLKVTKSGVRLPKTID